MDFERSLFGKMQLWIHYYRYLFVKKNVFNYSELHFSEVTSYKIHTLVSNSNHIKTYVCFVKIRTKLSSLLLHTVFSKNFYETDFICKYLRITFKKNQWQLKSSAFGRLHCEQNSISKKQLELFNSTQHCTALLFSNGVAIVAEFWTNALNSWLRLMALTQISGLTKEID